MYLTCAIYCIAHIYTTLHNIIVVHHSVYMCVCMRVCVRACVKVTVGNIMS